jgi:hypothetical protein
MGQGLIGDTDEYVELDLEGRGVPVAGYEDDAGQPRVAGVFYAAGR